LVIFGLSHAAMNTNEKLIHQFYTAFQHKDYVTMQELYHPKASFSDPVFHNLKSQEVKAMWEMLITSGKDLKVSFSQVTATDTTGTCRWEAWYTFSRTGRKVHNIIDASFEFQDGKILRHVDVFDFWRWSRQALGVSGLLLGWTAVIRNKVSEMARKSLRKFMNKGDTQ
jgi:ketosteroid isomerase-like protein